MLCPHCKAGLLIQLADENNDTAWCPICEEIVPDCIVRIEPETYYAG